jgi:hypothetical protein
MSSSVDTTTSVLHPCFLDVKKVYPTSIRVAAAEKAGHPVTAPGVLPAYGDPASLISTDAIQP